MKTRMHALLFVPFILSSISCAPTKDPFASLTESPRQDYYRNQFRIALNAHGYNLFLPRQYPVTECVRFQDNDDHFHYNRGALVRILHEGGKLTKRETHEDEYSYIGIYLSRDIIGSLTDYLPKKEVYGGVFEESESSIDLKYVCALGTYEYEQSREKRDFNAFSKARFISFEKGAKIATSVGDYRLVGLFKEIRAELTAFYGDLEAGEALDDFEYSFLKAVEKDGFASDIREIDDEFCSANRDPLISNPLGKPNVYLPKDVSLPFVEALFTPHSWLGGHAEVASYGYVEDKYLYYPIKRADEGDVSLSEEELSFITGGYLEEETRNAIREIVNIKDFTQPESSSSYMKVAKIDYGQLFDALGE